jgi:hypothetical protein
MSSDAVERKLAAATQLKEEGNGVYEADAEVAVLKYQEALSLLTSDEVGGGASEAVRALRVILHSNSSEAFIQLGLGRKAVSEAEKALAINPLHEKSLSRLARGRQISDGEDAIGAVEAQLDALEALSATEGDSSDPLGRLEEVVAAAKVSFAKCCDDQVLSPKAKDVLQQRLDNCLTRKTTINVAEVRDPVLGRVLIAKRSIRRLGIVLSEQPLLAFDDVREGLVAYLALPAAQKALIDGMQANSESVLEEHGNFPALARVCGTSADVARHFVALVNTNAHKYYSTRDADRGTAGNYVTLGQRHSSQTAFFHIASLVQHSCKPNVIYTNKRGNGLE